MILLVPFGRPARAAVADRIAEVRRRDVLAAVTVIVPSNYAGLALRRALASEAALVNVRFLVAPRLAELLGAPALAAQGRRPLTPWLRSTAVRAALAAEPGVFAGVAEHPATARELARVFAELRNVSAEGLARLRNAGQRSADVVRLYRAFRALTSDFFDEVDLMESAANALANSPADDDIGSLIVYLPRRLNPAFRDLLKSAAARRDVDAIIGLTGDVSADASAEALAESLDFCGPTRREQPSQPQVSGVISTTDAEEEAREAIRQVMALAASGTPLHRIAIAYTSRETYGALLDDQLRSAEVAHNGPPALTLGDTVAGRTIVGLPRLAAGSPGFERDVVMDWLTSAPIHFQGREAPAHRWDELSRDAGVVKGHRQWADRLEQHALAQEIRAAELGDEGEAYARRAGLARGLAAFVAELHASLGHDRPQPAADHARQALSWLKAYLPDSALDDEAQFEAHGRVQRQLEEIESLRPTLPAALDPNITRAQFAVALEEALAAPFGRVGKLGEGVFCAPLSVVAEMEFDTVIVLGLAEGVLPSSSRDDPILTSTERATTNGELPQPASVAEQRRTFTAALLAGGLAIVSAPRADLRAQRPAQPSRWLLEAASRLHGSPVYVNDFEKMLSSPPGWLRLVSSFESAVQGDGERASLQEWDLASLIGFRGRLARHFLLAGAANPLARGMAAARSRRRRGPGKLDEWLGKVPAGRSPVPGASVPISPTALETFAQCPFRYFLGHVLRVGEVERPEAVVTIEPATIGQIVHQVLQNFFEATKDRLDPLAEWSDEERQSLLRFAAETFDEYEARGQTGKSLTWTAEQARLRRDLELLLDEEISSRKLTKLVFREAEVAFGIKPRSGDRQPLPPALLTLPDGSDIAFRGFVDRVDEGPDGALSVVDYKTGSTRRYKSLKSGRLAGGKFLQLPIYALAFRQPGGSPVKALYWFISEQAAFERMEVTLNEETYGTLGTTVGTLVQTMRDGYFPAIPGTEEWRSGTDTHANCVYCPYDRICPSTQRTEAWDAARTDPGLANFINLATEDEDD